jgi:guanylate kinase
MNEFNQKKGVIIVISGPSGVGKSTICSRIKEQLPEVYVNVSVTTRPKADNEADGQDYWYISRQEFEKHIENGDLLEHAEVFGNLYGTLKEKIVEQLNHGKNVILEIDVQGGTQVKRLYKDATMIFIVPPTQKTLAERIKNRGREDIQDAETRLELADNEIAAAWEHYSHIVINDDLEQAVQEIVHIIMDIQ